MSSTEKRIRSVIVTIVAVAAANMLLSLAVPLEASNVSATAEDNPLSMAPQIPSAPRPVAMAPQIPAAPRPLAMAPQIPSAPRPIAMAPQIPAAPRPVA